MECSGCETELICTNKKCGWKHPGKIRGRWLCKNCHMNAMSEMEFDEGDGRGDGQDAEECKIEKIVHVGFNRHTDTFEYSSNFYDIIAQNDESLKKKMEERFVDAQNHIVQRKQMTADGYENPAEEGVASISPIPVMRHMTDD